jgi:LuxR family maltose regulon positive regulatory protein
MLMQQYPLLQTKLHIPPIRPELVSRPRPIERLNAGLDRKLTLVSAPAGFGKTTLVSDASTDVDGALTFLVEHLPPHMHLVIATRENPQLSLARLRARGQLTEVRVADLRFTPAEAAEFLNRAKDSGLAAKDIAALEARTEGWIAGLQLAALALQGTISTQGHKATSGFIESFTGSHHFVLDYLIEEVLHQQPESVQNFLLQTAILNRPAQARLPG